MEVGMLQHIDILLAAALGGLVTLLIKNYLPSYAREKGKNLATKEDIECITQKIESIKVEYSKQIETYKVELWEHQQRYLWAQEETKVKIDAFKKAIIDVARLINLVKKYQFYLSERELALAASGISKTAANQELHKLYLDKYDQYAELTAKTYSEFRDVLAEMGGLHALFSVYFSQDLSKALIDILNLGNHEAEQKMTFEEISEHLLKEHKACGSLESARLKVGSHYDKLCSTNALSLKSQHLFDLLKTHVNTVANPKPQK